MYYLCLVNLNILYDIHGVLFETTEESNQGRTLRLGQQYNQLGLTSKRGREYEGEYGTHLFKSFSPVFAVGDLHPVLLIYRDVRWLST